MAFFFVCTVLNIKCISVIFDLQEYSKKFRYIMVLCGKSFTVEDIVDERAIYLYKLIK